MSRTERGRQHRRGLGAEVFPVFERQVLVFPLLVVFLACASFLFGGRCAAWQWWVAVAVVVGVPFLQKGGWKAALGAAGLFAGVLVVVKGFLPPLFWDNAGCVDMQVYHLPQIQLLIEGWNPVEDPLAEGICANLGLDLWGMAPLHVAFLPKTMAVFAAVAYQFVGDPIGVTIPGLAFLWSGVALQVLRQFRGMGRWMVAIALVFVLPLVDSRMFVDLSLAFASCGLLFTMTDDMKRSKCSWLHLGIWATWMATIKLNGLLALAVFGGLYATMTLWRERKRWMAWLGHFALLGMAIGILASVIAWNPYGTSWRTYGHPLYPFKTIDKEKLPIQDLTWDLRGGNEDYHQMGRLWLWIHEYLSPGLVKFHYARKLGRTDFAPKHLAMPADQWMECHERIALWLLFTLLLFHPRGRIWGMGGVLLTILVPRETIGFLRYASWLPGLGCLAAALTAESVDERMGKKWKGWAECGMLILLGGVGVFWMWGHARNVTCKAGEYACHRRQVHMRFWKMDRRPDKGVSFADFVPRYHYLRCMENHARLLAKELGWGAETKFLSAAGWQPTGSSSHLVRRPLWMWDERLWFASGQNRDERFIEDMGAPWYEANVWDGLQQDVVGEPWVLIPWGLYYIPWNDQTGHFMEYWLGPEAKEGESERERVWRRVRGVVHSWCVSYPQEVGKWLAGARR